MKRGSHKDLKFIALSGCENNDASSFLLFIDGYRILLDAGVSPGIELDLKLLSKFPPDLILISHAHIDHVGSLAKIHGKYPKVPIYMTAPTLALSKIVLDNVSEINARTDKENDNEGPEKVIEKIITVPFDSPFQFNELIITFHSAGHILGAAYMIIEGESTVLYTGDISNVDGYLVKKHYKERFPDPIDLIISESTFGDAQNISMRTTYGRLTTSMNKTLTQGGRILFPASSLGGCEEILYIVLKAMEEGKIPTVPIYFDGLAREIISVYDIFSELTNVGNMKQILEKKHLFMIEGIDHRNNIAYNFRKPSIIISPSSLLVGGPSVLYAKEILSEKLSSIIFCGVKASNTPAYHILESNKDSEIELIDYRNEKIHIIRKCDVYHHSLSIHCDKNELVAFLNTFRPEVIILIHGTSKSKVSLYKETNGKILNNIFTRIPDNNELVDVDFSRKLWLSIKTLAPYPESNNYLFSSFLESLIQEEENSEESVITKIIDQHIITKLDNLHDLVRFSSTLYLRCVLFTELTHFELGILLIERMSKLCYWLYGQSAVHMIGEHLRNKLVLLLRDYIIEGAVRDFGGRETIFNIEVLSMDDFSEIISLLNNNIPEEIMKRITLEEIKRDVDNYIDAEGVLNDKNLYSIFIEKKTIEKIEETKVPVAPKKKMARDEKKPQAYFSNSKKLDIPIIQDFTHRGIVSCYMCGKMDVLQDSSILVAENDYHTLITCNQCSTQFYLKSAYRRE